MTDNQKHWLVIGVDLVGVVVPSLRPFLDAGLSTAYTAFKSSWGIDGQAFGRILPSARHPSISNYKFINGNQSKAPYDYTVKSHVQLAKLYLRQLFMANFTAINDECDPSAVRYRMRPGKSVNTYEILGHIVIGLSGIHASFKPVFNSWIGCWQSVA